MLLLLPTAIAKAARQFGFDAKYGRLELNLIGTNAEVWDFTLSPRDSNKIVLATGYGELAEKLDVVGAAGLLKKPYGKCEIEGVLGMAATAA